jgi:glycerol uptake facilitator-like aquaporin
MKAWLAEFLGTALLVAAVVGSAFMATNLTDNQLLQLFINMVATVLTLGVCITLFAPISGAHFNPVVTVILALKEKKSLSFLFHYITAQSFGGISGALLANAMFTNKVVAFSEKNRNFLPHYLGELIATSVLILIILLAISYSQASSLRIMVPSWIGAAYFLTVSTSFANPAVTIARIFTENFSGINLQSALSFIVVQFAGGFLGLAIARVLEKRED